MGGMASTDLVSRQYYNAARATLCVQIPLAILCMLILDHCWTARVCGGTMLGFWVIAAMLAARRPWNPTAVDLWFWKWGFLPSFVIMLMIASELRS